MKKTLSNTQQAVLVYITEQTLQGNTTYTTTTIANDTGITLASVRQACYVLQLKGLVKQCNEDKYRQEPRYEAVLASR